jgi:hypothetical protein
LVQLEAGSVTVPAGGDAPMAFTVAAQGGGAGEYSGILTARSAGGTVTTRTALSVYQEEEKFDLTVNVIDRDGVATTAKDISVIDLDHAGNVYP